MTDRKQDRAIVEAAYALLDSADRLRYEAARLLTDIVLREEDHLADAIYPTFTTLPLTPDHLENIIYARSENITYHFDFAAEKVG